MSAKDRFDRVDNQQDFQKILTAKSRVIALWYASWCPFCRKFLPIFEKHAEAEGRNFLLVRDDQESMGGKYAVEVLPTVLFFENGAVSKRLDGIPGVGLTEKQMVDFIKGVTV
ncbi:MAG: thioredoxin family protein [Pseudomonadota bacterium]